MRASLLLLFAVLSSPLRAQLDDLLRNPDISWIGTFTTDYELNPVYNDRLESEYNLLEIIRLQNDRQTNGLYREIETPHYLSQEMLDGLMDGVFPCFADALLTQPLSAGQVQERLNHPEQIPGCSALASRNDAVQASDIDLFRVRQALFFNIKKQAFETRLLAVAPLLNLPDEAGNTTGREPALWLKILQRPGHPRRKPGRKASYSWQTRQKDNIPEWGAIDVQKGKMDLQSWANAEVARPAHPTLRADTYAKIDARALRALLFSTDTIATFDEDGRSVIDRIVRKNALDQVEKLRLVQHWTYDEQRKTLDCRVVAVAPVATVRDEDGAFRYDKPLFYIRY